MPQELRSEGLLRILFDVNVLLDVILEREPHARAAAELLAEVERGTMSGLLCAVTVPTIHYIVRRKRGREQSRRAVRRLLGICEIAPVTRSVLDDALELGFSDYEDAVQHEAARHASADGIVTRNIKDYKPASLSIYAPDQLLEAIQRR